MHFRLISHRQQTKFSLFGHFSGKYGHASFGLILAMCRQVLLSLELGLKANHFQILECGHIV